MGVAGLSFTTRWLLKHVGIGIVATAAVMAAAVVVSVYLLPWGFLLVGGSFLFLLLVVLMYLAVEAGSQPPTWNGGFLSIYTEMMGRRAMGSGPRGMVGPPGRWSSPILWVALPPSLALLIIVVVGLWT